MVRCSHDSDHRHPSLQSVAKLDPIVRNIDVQMFLTQFAWHPAPSLKAKRYRPDLIIDTEIESLSSQAADTAVGLKTISYLKSPQSCFQIAIESRCQCRIRWQFARFNETVFDHHDIAMIHRF